MIEIAQHLSRRSAAHYSAVTGWSNVSVISEDGLPVKELAEARLQALQRRPGAQ
ncbi:MAG: hypothetical protein Q7R30_14210 [Acidobacteriota bacterium]|nr:hypothetical protein [Acidobacteriota bacterium]